MKRMVCMACVICMIVTGVGQPLRVCADGQGQASREKSAQTGWSFVYEEPESLEEYLIFFREEAVARIGEALSAVQSILVRLGVAKEKETSSILPGTVIEFTVNDTAAAMEALDVMGFYYGYDSAEAVWQPEYARETGLFTVYHFSQIYNGLSVEGHNMDVIVDEEGKVLYFEGNYFDVGELLTDPWISAQEAAAKVEEETGEEVYTAKLCIIVDEDTPYLAWKLATDTGYWCLTKTTLALFLEGILYEEESKNDGSSGSLALVGQEPEDGLLEVSVVYDSSEDVYYLINEEYGCAVYSSPDERLFSIGEEDLVSFREVSDCNSSAVDALYNFQRVYEFYASSFNHISPDGVGTAETSLVVDVERTSDGEQFINNAFTWTMVDEQAAFIYFSVSDGTAYNDAHYPEVVAHEYTHAVQAFIIEDGYYTEQGQAVNEGIADILAELCSAYYNDGAMDWYLEDCEYGRDMANPRSWILSPYVETYAQYSDSLDEHYASTLISHTAYLMNCQPDKGSEYAIEDAQTLAELWYNAIYLMNPDSGFSDCRTAVECVAEYMLEQGKLTQEQYEGVRYAFTCSGIPDEKMISFEDGDIE